jgi:hypothetical protein
MFRAVDLEHLDFDLLADVDRFARVVNRLRATHLRDVDQTDDLRRQLEERSVGLRTGPSAAGRRWPEPRIRPG